MVRSPDMLDQSFSRSVSPFHSHSSPSPKPPEAALDGLARTFNSALLGTRAAASNDSPRNPSAELQQLLDTPAMRAVLSSIRQLAEAESISDQQAAEMMIHCFRRTDRLWSEYLIQEGFASLKSQLDGI